METELEFNQIISDIIKNPKFKMLKYESHHGITRLDHSMNVAWLTYLIAKRTNNKKYKEVTRAALLHDLFLDSELVGKNSFVNHPNVAANNAKKEFNVGNLEHSMIQSHMFPVGFNLPKNKESWLLLSTDKLVAIYEMLKYKMPLYLGTFYLLLFNVTFK